MLACSGWAAHCVGVPQPQPAAQPKPAFRVPRARTRLHVNPLSPEFLQAPAVPDWPRLVADTSLPLHLDIGCAYGEFELEMAALDASANYVGIDLRERPLQRAQALRDVRQLRNAAFVFANARHEEFLTRVLTGYAGTLRAVSCLFPDPWKKAHMRRRRLLQPALVSAVADAMLPGGAFITATDNAELAAEMRAPFDADAERWRNLANSDDGFVAGSPYPVVTAWESTIRGRSSPTYWSHYVRR